MSVLVGALREVDATHVLAALRATELHRVTLAACAVAAGYCTLALYDWFALRTLGHDGIPFRVAARAGFTSYAIAHTVGAVAIVAAAVRYRIYSAHGLGISDVAKIGFVAALTFWLGNATVLGFGVAMAPDAAALADRLPASVNRAGAILVLGVILAYLVWLWQAPRSVGFRSLRIPLPTLRSTLLQIGIGALDLLFCALAMYLLLPIEPRIPFATVAVVFLSSTLLGFLSNSPGGLGVFDAMMLLAFDGYEKDALIASLLLFRCLYYLTPFTLALLLLGKREIAAAIAALAPVAGARLRRRPDA